MARGLRQYVLSGTDSADFAKGPSGWIGNFHLLQRRTEKTDPVEGETGSDYSVSQAIMAEAGIKNFTPMARIMTCVAFQRRTKPGLWGNLHL